MREQHLGEGTGGVWTAAHARACGLSAREAQGRLATGVWQRLRRGTYCDGGVLPTPLMGAWAAVLVAGGPAEVWCTGRTTLRLLGLPLIDDDDPATGARDIEHDDVVVRTARRDQPTLHPTQRRLPAQSRGEIRGCPSASLPQALAHAATLLTFEALVCVLDAALHRQLTSAAALDELVLATQARRGGRRLRAAVASADGRAESPLETLGRLELLPVLPGLVPQVEILDGAGYVLARVDLGDAQLGLAVEGDGRTVHTGMAADDHRRDRVIRRRGWHTERYTWFEVRRQPAALRRRMLDAATGLRGQQRDCA